MNTIEAVASKVNVKAIAKAFAITVTFAFLYWAVCMMSPELSKSSLMGVLFGKTLRFATMLKAFVIVTPYAAIGNAVGSMVFNVQSGDPIAYGLMYLQAAIGLMFWWVSHSIGRSVLKDLAVLSVYGFINGAIAAMKLTAVSMLIHNETWSNLIGELIKWKMLTSALMLVSGYLLVLAFEAGMKGIQEWKK